MSESIADDTVGPAALLEWDEPLGIAFFSDHATKADLIARLRALADPRDVHIVHEAAKALPFANNNALIIIDPQNEKDTVLFFDRNRDHFEGVKARFLILLLRGGSGEQALKDAPALASFARDASFEISSPPHRDDARATFQERNDVTPEEWLRRWRSGELPDNQENNYILSDALVLEDHA
jgi:hypothetical protein